MKNLSESITISALVLARQHPGLTTKAHYSHLGQTFRYWAAFSLLDHMEPDKSSNPQIEFEGQCFRVDFCPEWKKVEDELKQLNGDAKYFGGVNGG